MKKRSLFTDILVTIIILIATIVCLTVSAKADYYDFNATMENAHAMAEAARNLGYAEDHCVI